MTSHLQFLNSCSVAQWLRRCITKPKVVGSILADATAFADCIPFRKVLKPDCLFPTHGCAEAFIIQWINRPGIYFLTVIYQSAQVELIRALEVPNRSECKSSIM